MTEVGVLFRGPLVRALLRPIDPKTQTRRLITPRVVGRGPDPAKGPIRTELAPDGTACMIQGDVGYPLPRCRYGRPGDRLWVRETWSKDALSVYPCPPIWYRADFLENEDPASGEHGRGCKPRASFARCKISGRGVCEPVERGPKVVPHE